MFHSKVDQRNFICTSLDLSNLHPNLLIIINLKIDLTVSQARLTIWKSYVIKYSRKIMLLQHPMKTNAEAITGFMLVSLPATFVNSTSGNHSPH